MIFKLEKTVLILQRTTREPDDGGFFKAQQIKKISEARIKHMMSTKINFEKSRVMKSYKNDEKITSFSVT